MLEVLIVCHRLFKFRDHVLSWSQQIGLLNTDFSLFKVHIEKEIHSKRCYAHEDKTENTKQTNQGRSINPQKTKADENAA